MSNKKILDVTCGTRTMWFNKNHPNAIYCDKRDEALTGIWKSTNGLSERTCYVHPDIQCDFTCLPFDDNSFSLVVFDPPLLYAPGIIRGWLKSTASSIKVGNRQFKKVSWSVCVY